MFDVLFDGNGDLIAMRENLVCGKTLSAGREYPPLVPTASLRPVPEQPYTC
jgi:hypothetical protein